MKLKWTLLIVITIFWVLGGIGLILQIYPTLPEETKVIEIMKSAFLVLGGLGVVLPTYLNIWQSLESSQVLEEKIQFDRMENSFRILENWDDPSLLEARRFTRRIKDTRTSLSDNQLIEEIDKNETLKESVIMVFNYWEGVRISIWGNRVNVPILFDSIGEIYLDMFERFKPWIRQDELRLRHFSELYKRWNKFENRHQLGN